MLIALLNMSQHRATVLSKRPPTQVRQRVRAAGRARTPGARGGRGAARPALPQPARRGRARRARRRRARRRLPPAAGARAARRGAVGALPRLPGTYRTSHCTEETCTNYRTLGH